MSIHDDMDLSE